MPKDNLLSVLFKSAGGLASSYPGFKESEEDRQRVEQQQAFQNMMAKLGLDMRQQENTQRQSNWEADRSRELGQNTITNIGRNYTEIEKAKIAANKQPEMPAEMQKILMLQKLLNPDEFKQYLGVAPKEDKPAFTPYQEAGLKRQAGNLASDIYITRQNEGSPEQKALAAPSSDSMIFDWTGGMLGKSNMSTRDTTGIESGVGHPAGGRGDIHQEIAASIKQAGISLDQIDWDSLMRDYPGINPDSVKAYLR